MSEIKITIDGESPISKSEIEKMVSDFVKEFQSKEASCRKMENLKKEEEQKELRHKHAIKQASILLESYFKARNLKRKELKAILDFDYYACFKVLLKGTSKIALGADKMPLGTTVTICLFKGGDTIKYKKVAFTEAVKSASYFKNEESADFAVKVVKHFIAVLAHEPKN